MKKIESFQVDHNLLLKGVYVSRKDKVGSETVTTFDIRMKEPNREPVLKVPAIHTIEHLGATFLRSHGTLANQVIYFGPMGCRTGFYLIMGGEWTSEKVLPLIREMFDFVSSYNGEIPGASPVECGNYSEQDLAGAKEESGLFLKAVLENPSAENLNYPQ